MEVIHLEFHTSQIAWLGRLQTRLRYSHSEELRTRYSRWAEAGLGQLALDIATRLTICDRVHSRLAELLEEIRTELRDWSGLDEAIDGQHCFRPARPAVSFDICEAVDGLIFEFRSVYELIGKFAKLFAREMLGIAVTQDELLGAVRASGGESDWVELVREHRILFFHEAAPWIAMQVHRRKPASCSLLVMKGNIGSFENPQDYLTEHQLVAAISGLKAAVPAVVEWLEARLAETESSMVGATGRRSGC